MYCAAELGTVGANQSDMHTMKPGVITEDQSFAISLLYKALGVKSSRYGYDFEAIRALIPRNLKVVHGLINDELARSWASGELEGQERCRFKAGHKIIR